MRTRFPVAYILLILVFGGGSFLVIRAGRSMPEGSPAESRQASGIGASPADAAKVPSVQSKGAKLGRHGLFNPFSLLLLQIMLIVSACGLLGAVLRKLGQPSVIGEMGVGILLGPSLLGRLFPETSAILFPQPSLGILGLLGQLGVMCFLFLVGMEVRLDNLKKSAQSDLLISHAGIFFPFFLGVLIAPALHHRYGQSSLLSLSLFLGIAMSVTAFPVLARILTDSGLADTPLGRSALAIAAIDDFTAWCALGFVIAAVESESPRSALMNSGLSVAFLLAMVGLVKPILGKTLDYLGDGNRPNRPSLVLAISVLLLSSLCAEVLGLHALFGAFLAGLAMPDMPRLKQFIRERLEYVSVGFLLPIFFALVGLKTDIGFLRAEGALAMLALVTGAAVVGKFGGTLVASRFAGFSWRRAACLGALMNTRGLMEIVILSIGSDLGILSSQLFTIMVLMALATTMMTGPLLSVLNRKRDEGDHSFRNLTRRERAIHE